MPPRTANEAPRPDLESPEERNEKMKTFKRRLNAAEHVLQACPRTSTVPSEARVDLKAKRGSGRPGVSNHSFSAGVSVYSSDGNAGRHGGGKGCANVLVDYVFNLASL